MPNSVCPRHWGQPTPRRGARHDRDQNIALSARARVPNDRRPARSRAKSGSPQPPPAKPHSTGARQARSSGTPTAIYGSARNDCCVPCTPCPTLRREAERALIQIRASSRRGATMICGRPWISPVTATRGGQRRGRATRSPSATRVLRSSRQTARSARSNQFGKLVGCGPGVTGIRAPARASLHYYCSPIHRPPGMQTASREVCEVV